MQPKAYSYVRFSTPEQSKGDSLRRQTEAAEEWAKAHGLILDDRLRDEGLSAFKGLHKIKGALGRFLNLVEAGKVPKGSVLIVEAMDRLSREQVTDALTQFMGIIKAGVQVVTLMDGKSFTEQSINANPFDLMYSIMNMTLANQESEKKAKRLKETWDNKRNGINGRVLTGKCPAWLKRSDDWKSFQRIPDRCKVIGDIFKWKAKGLSPYAIEKRLNETSGIWKPEGGGRQKGNKTGWRKSYIQKILRSSAVIGEYQPHRLVEGKRQPVGDPIPNYFPIVVKPDVFYQVQEKIKSNRETFKGGRTGKVSNLFSYLTKCGYCGGQMTYISKGKAPRGTSWLVCDKARRHNGCKSAPWRYDKFEEELLRFLSYKINVMNLLPDRDQTEQEVDSLRTERESIRGQLSRAEREIENLTASIATTPDRRVRGVLENKLSGVLDRKEQLEKAARETEEKITALERSGRNIQERVETMKELTAYLRKAKPEKAVEIRLKLREAVRGAVGEITLFPKGFKDKKHVHEYESDPDRRKACYEGIDNKDWRFYRLGFKGSGFTRAVYPPGMVQKLKQIGP